ncbi:MAG: Calx-beta domain-containing protein [Limisphaerales bacterium]
MRNAVCAAWVACSGFLTIAQSQPVVDINDTQVIEGNSGTTNAEFVIALSAPWTNALTVAYTTFEVPYDYLNQPYPAHSGVDFVATNGTVTFAPGETNKSVNVKVIGDTVNEANEPFGLGLSLQGQGTLGRSSGQCMILDDDPLEIYVNDVTTLEGPAGAMTIVPVTLTTYDATEQEVYAVCSPSGGTATANVDYSTYPSRWQLDPGPARTNVACCIVVVNGDDTNEDDETFLLNPSLGFGRFSLRPKDTNPQNARGVVFVNQPKCTIINDDFYLNVRSVSTNRTQLTLFGALNATHVLQWSSNLVNWQSFSTNVLGSERQVSMTVTNSGKLFYRALRTVDLNN